MDALEIEITSALREKLEYFMQLHDFYGVLLTDRQNTCFTMHYIEDLSLAEIGEVLGITPQAVADQLKRTVSILRRYDEKMELIKNWQKQKGQLKQLSDALTKLIAEGYPLDEIKVMLDNILAGDSPLE